jgi:MFS family permease
MTMNGLGFGALIPYIPLLAGEKALANPGLFYAIYSFCLIFSRGLTGQLSRRFGRSTVLMTSIVSVTLTMGMLAWTASGPLFLVAAGIYGLANGVLQPSLLALTMDRAPRQATGSAMATFTLLNDLGTAAGQFGMAYVGASLGYSNSLLGIALLSVLGWVLYAWPSHSEVEPDEELASAN